MSRRQAAEILSQRTAAAGNTRATRSRVAFRTLVTEWEQSILPMYKPSTQKHRRWILKKHVLPEFGDRAVCEIARQGHPRVCRSPHAPRIRAEVHRSHSRCTERHPSHGCEVGASPGESSSRGRTADAPVCAAEMGAHAGAGGDPDRGASATRADHGRPRGSVRVAARRAVRAALARHRSGCVSADRARPSHSCRSGSSEHNGQTQGHSCSGRGREDRSHPTTCSVGTYSRRANVWDSLERPGSRSGARTRPGRINRAYQAR
jgi:hypothetical protein